MNGLQAIGALIIRLWAIGVVFGALSWLAYLPYPVKASDIVERSFIFAAIDNAVWLALGLGGWLLAPRISKAAVPASAQNELSVTIGARELVEVGSFLIGGYYLITYFPKVIGRVITIAYELADRPQDADPRIDPFYFHNLTIEALIFTVALFLTFRPREIANMFSALRVAGLSKAEKD